MKYSFTQPLQKSIISHITKIWIFYIMLSVAIIYISGVYLNISKDTLIANTRYSENSINSQDATISAINKNIARLEYEIKLDKTNTFYNNELKNALDNILELIPDNITITQLSLEERRLVLKGVTPTREDFAFKLQAPLRSVFTTSKVDFFQLSNGWYNFTSISELKEEK